MARDDTEWDDLEWPENRVEATRQIVFGIGAGGPLYEMVLCDTNAELLEKTFAQYIERARSTGLKVPALPRELRADLPHTPGLALDLTPGRKAATSGAGQSESAGVKATQEFDRSLPGGGMMPEDFWATPGGSSAPWAVRMEFQELRKEIRSWAGEDPDKQGRVPREMGYNWGREHPERVWAIQEKHGL